MKKILDYSVGGHKRVKELDGAEFGDDLAVVTKENISSVMRKVGAYSQPRFSKVDRFTTEVGSRVFIDYIRPGYDLYDSGLEYFQRDNGSTVQINVSKVCMIESFWLVEFNYQEKYDYEVKPMAVLVKIDDEEVREMLKTGSID